MKNFNTTLAFAILIASSTGFAGQEGFGPIPGIGNGQASSTAAEVESARQYCLDGTSDVAKIAMKSAKF